MTNPFGAAIENLGRINSECIRDPRGGCYQCNSRRAAIRLLEAAGIFTADDKERIANALDQMPYYTPIAGYKCPGKVLRDKFTALLAALPDKEAR